MPKYGPIFTRRLLQRHYNQTGRYLTILTKSSFLSVFIFWTYKIHKICKHFQCPPRPLSYEAWLTSRNEDASKKIFVAIGIVVFDFELFISDLFTSSSYVGVALSHNGIPESVSG